MNHMFKNKVMLLMSSFVLIIILIMSIVMLSFSRHELLDSAKENLLLHSKNNALHFNSNIKKIEVIVDDMVIFMKNQFKQEDDIQAVKNYGEREFIPLADSIYETGLNHREIIAFYFYFNPDFFGVHNNISYAYDENGAFVRLRILPEQDYYSGDVDMEWFFKPLNQKSDFWFEPYYWPLFETNIITYSKAVIYKDEALGVIGIDLDVDYVIDYFEKNSVFKSSQTFLMNASHEVIIQPDQENDSFGQNMLIPDEIDLEIQNHIEEQSENHQNDVIFESANYVISHSDLSNGWIIMTYALKSEIFEPVNNLMRFIFFLLMIIILFSILISRYISGMLSKPIERLAGSIKNFRLDEKTPVDSTGVAELDVITQSFNHMAKSVTESYEIIREQNMELESAYIASNELSDNLEEIISLTASISVMAANSEIDYLFNILRISLNLIKRSDSALIGKFEEGELQYFCSAGQLDREQAECLIKVINGDQTVSSVKRSESFDTTDYITAPMDFADKKIGLLILANSQAEPVRFTNEDRKFLNAFANLAASYFGVQQQMKYKTTFRESLLYAIIELVELHDPYTRGHSESVSSYSVMLAEKMNFSDREISTVKWAGLVHDIGKILIPNEILKKPTKLNEAEYALIKKHPEYGAKVLFASEEVKEVATIVNYHHERWDGTGYPEGLKGEEIPLVSRVISVADAFDAMISDRPYRKGLSIHNAREEIRKNSGTQFDPEIVEIFLEIDFH